MLKIMEALVYNSQTGELKYEENYPIPKIEKDDEVIIKVEYSGVCGTDLHIIQGEFPVIEGPLVLGHEFSGVVFEAGAGTRFQKGQKVVVDPNRACNICRFCRKGRYNYCSNGRVMNYAIGTRKDGGWARYMKIPQDQLYLLPDELTTEQGALCEPYSCVSHGFDRASPLLVGEKILICGAGIIGNMWVSTLHHHGHRDVTVSEMNKTRLDIVKKLETGFRLITPDILEKEKEQYDVIIDCTGVGKVLEINFNYLIEGGKYVIFGCCPPMHQALLNPFQIFDKELTLIGVKINPFSFPNALGWMKAMGNRYLDYDKLGVKIYSMSEYEKAIADLKAGNVAKAIFKID